MKHCLLEMTIGSLNFLLLIVWLAVGFACPATNLAETKTNKLIFERGHFVVHRFHRFILLHALSIVT